MEASCQQRTRTLRHNGGVTTFTPAAAVATCETAIRELMTYAYSTTYGSTWLTHIVATNKLESWDERTSSESNARKGMVAAPSSGLNYANFYDLISIADKHWEPLASALGKKASTLPLLRRFDNIRNSVAHSRPLLQFEHDLMSGIAGQIRNQVTIFMSAQDDVGDIYPRIESVMDGYGRRVESATVEGEIAGSCPDYGIIVRPGDTVVFECVGVDPQDRDLEWTLTSANSHTTTLIPSGEPAVVSWQVTDEDVNETAMVEIYLAASEAKYHRFGTWDHRTYFGFRVRPPL